MLKFVLGIARDIDQLGKTLENLRSHSLHTLPIWPNNVYFHLFEELGMFLLAYENTKTSGISKTHVKQVGDSFFMFDGLPYFNTLNRENYLESVYEHHCALNEETFLSTTFGSWSKVWFSRRGIYAINDFTGTSPLYYYDKGGLRLLGNRQLLLSCAVNGDVVEIDRHSAAWLTGQASHFGDQMLVADVQHVPPASPVRFDPERPGVRFKARALFTPARQISAELDRHEINAASDDLVGQMSALSNLVVDKVRLDITGGMDSRLVVALASNSDLAPKIDCLQTSGATGSREIEVGSLVARSLGLAHHARIIPQQSFSTPTIMERIRAQTFKYEGMICPTDAYSVPSKHSSLTVSGAAGEIYRRHSKPHMKLELRGSADIHRHYRSYQQDVDPISVQRPHVSEQQRDTLRELALSFYDDGAEPNDIADIFFLRYRLPHWNGVIFSNIFRSTRVLPLANLRLARLAFSKPYKYRIADRYHFEIMANVSPALAQMPFLDNRWSGSITPFANARGLALPHAAFQSSTRPSLRDAIPIGHHLTSAGSKVMLDYIEERWNHGLNAIYDLQRVRQVFSEAAQAPQSVSATKAYCSLISTVALLSSDYVHEVEGETNVPVHCQGRQTISFFGSPTLDFASSLNSRLNFKLS